MKAFIIGGTGQIGTAVARTLARSGWQVTACDRGSRDPAPELGGLGVERRIADRAKPGELEAALGEGADVLIDTVTFEPAQARQLVSVEQAVRSLIAISSASVYKDDQGRTLDEATSDEDLPRLPVPIDETHPTVEAGKDTYSTRKVAMEQELLSSNVPATIIRPCAVHGPFSRRAREWHFLKRALAGDRKVVIDYGGRSRFHTSSTENIAELARLAAGQPGDRILNCGDPDPPTTLEIARAAWAYVGREPPVEELLEGPGEDEERGATPWSIPHPFVMSMARAEQDLGYAPATTYAESVRATFSWLAASPPAPTGAEAASTPRSSTSSRKS